MARASSGSSFSSSCSALPPPASSPPCTGPRKKKIGALLSSYYNLENENIGEEAQQPSAAAATTSERGGGRAAAASNGAVLLSTSASQLQQQPCAPRRHPLAGSDKAGRGGGDGTASAASSSELAAAAACTSFNPFSPAEEFSSGLVFSGPAAGVGKREEGAAVSSDAARRSPRGAGGGSGGGGVGAAAVDGCSSSSFSGRSGMELGRSRGQSSLGEGTAAAPRQEEEKATVAAAKFPTAAATGGGGGGGFAAAAGGALAAAAAGGLGLLLGEEEESSGHQLMRWSEKEEGTAGFLEASKNIDSEQFDVRAFFSAAVESMSLRELLQASSKLDEEVRQCEGELQMLVYENYTKFLEAAETVRGVKEDMQALQGDMTQLAVRAEAIEGSSKELDDLVRDRAASIEELVSFRQLLDKLQILFTLPDVLRWYLSNNDTESVLSVYLRVCPFLQQQEAAFPKLQRIHLLHAEAATLFQAAKRRLRQQLVGSQAPAGAAPLRDSCSSKSSRGFDGSSGSCAYQTSSVSSGYGSKHLSTRGAKSKEQSSSGNSSRKDSVVLWPVPDNAEEDTGFLSAAAASRVFHLLLHAGEPPRELLQLYMRDRMHLLQQLLLRVFAAQQLLEAGQPASQDVKEPPQQKQPGSQQQQETKPQLHAEQEGQRTEDGISATQNLHTAPAPAAPSLESGETAAAAAATETCASEAGSVSSAAAAQVLDAACNNLSQLFMEPFVAALQDILRLRPAGESTPNAITSAADTGDKWHVAAFPAAAPSTSCAGARSASAAARKPGGAVQDAADRSVSAAAALCAAAVARGENAAQSAAAAAATTDSTPAVASDRAAGGSLSAEDLEESVRDFLLPVLLRVLEGFLRLVTRLNAPAAAVVEAIRTLRAVLLERLQGLLLPELLKESITKRFQNFTYQLLSACVAAVFRAAYFQAAEELAAIQRFCFSCTETGATAAAKGDAAAATTGQTAPPHSSNIQVGDVCFFLGGQEQEAALQLLTQKEHALLLRGCLAVTDAHYLIEGVCGVRSSLAEKLVLEEVSKWIAGFFSVFIAAVLRLARDTPAALQDCPLLRAEAEGSRRREADAYSSSSSGTNTLEQRSSNSKRESLRKRSGDRSSSSGFSSTFLAGKEDEQRKTKRCFKCCYCWRYYVVEAAATCEGDSSAEKQPRYQIDDFTSVASVEKALLSRCTPVEEEVAEAVTAAVVEHLWTRTGGSKPQRSREADAIGPDVRQEDSRGASPRRCLATHPLPAEHPPVNAPAQNFSGDSTTCTSQVDILPGGMQTPASHAGTRQAHVVVKQAVPSGNVTERESDALVGGTELLSVGRTALCCVLLMRLGRSLELHGVSKVTAVAAELFPSFPVDSFIPTSPPSGAVSETAAGDNGAGAAAPSPGCGEGTVPAAAASADVASASRLSKQKRQQHTAVKDPPLTQLRQVLQAALVTYVYLRGCQGAVLTTAALRKLLVCKVPFDLSPRVSSADAAACSFRDSAVATPASAASSTKATDAAAAFKTTAGARERQHERADEWLALKDKEAQCVVDTCAVQAEAAVGLAALGEAAGSAMNAPTKGQVDLSANAAAASVREEAADVPVYPPTADISSSASTAASSVSPFLKREVASISPSQTTATNSAAGRSDADVVDTAGEGATDGTAANTAAVAAQTTADNNDAECVPVEVVGLMDTLLLLLHHCDEETFVFLGEQKFSGSGVMLLRSVGVGGGSAALLPGSARLPRRLQAAAAAGDAAAAAAVEQRQHQHVRRLARLFGRRRTAIEKEMERLFARKQPVFSRVSLNRHKALMAIFKVACRPFLEAIRSRHFTRLEVRQMQVECAAAAESLRDLVASEDGCVVDGLLDELLASSLRRCLHTTQLDESVDAVTIGQSAAAGSIGSNALHLGSSSVPASAAANIRRSLPAGAVSRWGSAAAESSVAAAYTRMAEGRGTGVGDTGEDNDVLLKPTIVEEICNRSNDRYQQLLTSNIGVR